MKKYPHNLLLLLVTALFSLTSSAQKTGNIVEIFGKEKIENTSEGTVIHTFSDGLVLRKGVVPGLINGYNDIVFWQMATGKFRSPVAGQTIENLFSGQAEGSELKWESTKVDSTGVFKDNLSRSLLYTSFE